MIRNRYEMFKKEELENIRCLYEKQISISQIATGCNLSYNEVLAILNYLNYRLDPKNLASVILSDELAIFIADTHFGSKYENYNYLDTVYEYAKQNGINSIIHLGDLLQGSISNVVPRKSMPIRQIIDVVDNYPFDEEIKNYILFGNHDYHALKKREEYLNILQRREDFNLLGFKSSYISLNDCLIFLKHSIDKYKLSLPNYSHDLMIKGHGHEFMLVNNTTIKAPTLSDDMKCREPHNRPGFLVVASKKKHLKVYRHAIYPNNITEELVLSKKIK